jgi:putative tributyrin esterase
VNSPFHTTETSDPRLEFEGLRFVTVKSRALRGRADITFFAPSEAEKLHEVPLVILLHGVYGSHWGWAIKGAAHRTLQGLVRAGEVPPLALAMPSDGLWGDGSGYLPHLRQDFEKWIVEEVPAAAPAALPCVSTKAKLFIGGLSMGGFGALRLGAKYPQRFLGVSGHSSITHFDQLKQFVEENADDYGVSAENQSVFETMLKGRGTLPPIRFDCGTEDRLLKHNRELHQQLTASGIPHEYYEFPGGHEWGYWQTHLVDTLKFFGRILREGNAD